MISDEFIVEFRNQRENTINNWLDSRNLDKISLQYFDIDIKWRFTGDIKLNKDEPYSDDNTNKHKRVGSIKLTIEDTNIRLNLYRNLNDGKLYTYTKDNSSGAGSYPQGRFTPVFEIDEKFIIDFNASFAPACAHLGELVVCPRSLDRQIPFSIEAGEKFDIKKY